MAALAFDTLKVATALQPQFTKEQAETLARTFSDNAIEDLASKTDLALLESALRREIVGLRSELKGDMASLRSEMKGDMASLRSEFKGDMASLREDFASFRIDMVRWIVGAIAFNLLGTIGIMIALVRFVGR